MVSKIWPVGSAAVHPPVEALLMSWKTLLVVEPFRKVDFNFLEYAFGRSSYTGRSGSKMLVIHLCVF